MRADVLTSAGSWQSERPLLTYLVPSELQADVRVGQLVAVPYGERLVEGIVWSIQPEEDTNREGTINRAPTGEEVVRPLHAILDDEPALLGHQMALAEWIAEYYVTPLSQVALMMLPPGLMQRSQVVLHLVKDEYGESVETCAASSLQLRALMGLLLCEGELDVERLKTMLGPKRAKEMLEEGLASGLIEREAQLQRPKAKAQHKRIVRLIAQGEALEDWRRQKEARLQTIQPVPMAADNVRRRTSLKKSARQRKSALPDPWALPTVAATLTLQDKEALVAQHQLAAIHLLEQCESQASHRYWTQGMLCKACALTRTQLQQLVREQIIAIEEVEIRHDPLLRRAIPASTPLSLTPDQQQALHHIVGEETLQQYHIRPLLLHGVTGSGKTEVYLQALAAVIAQGKRGILLVPEIALTTQAVQRVAGRFPDRVAIIHGRLSVGERYDEWRRIRAGQVDVVIGSRSALFSPVPDLGIIILDEEHEPAYKQGERRPTYHAREVAIMLGYILHIPVVLGSATPAVATFYSAEQGAYRLVALRERIGATLPPVEVIDLRNELHSGNTSIISRRLHEELELVLNLGQQAILFLNRRGAASCILCRDCGFVAMCDRCDIPLTYHATERMLLCHYCGGCKKIIQFCPNCNSSGVRYFGLGTEKVEATLQRAFPSARLLRWDKDTARNLRAHQELLDSFANREADILVGTQMIAKGLDLPGVTLVGVISADIALNLPDFSASERAFTLLTQVAGRAGRGAEAGRVIIQTFNPQHFCIEAASRHDYHEFYATEIEARQRYGYPPFRQFVKFTYSHENRHRCQNEALLLAERLQEWIDRLGLLNTDIVGPAPALMERMRSKYRWQIIARGPDLHRLLRVIDTPGWEVDIDPVSTI
ncbi:MAG: primosomal protein N' [Ktedonobacteraceae bacterium]|nr:primosomal protein N' [Ktedonobacteraceae bacterium]